MTDDLRYNFYCDESCHLERDHQPAMALGSIYLPTHQVARVAADIRAIKARHGIRTSFEAKWTSVSAAQLPFYTELVSYFFADPDLRFRGLVAHDKDKTRFDEANPHDDWYYKMYYQLLSVLTAPPRHSFIYLDIKDTRGGPKAARLHGILANKAHDFTREYLERVQIVRSDEVAPMQLTDLLTGAIGAVARDQTTSEAKLAVIAWIRELSGLSLLVNTPANAPKLDIFHWRPRPDR